MQILALTDGKFHTGFLESQYTEVSSQELERKTEHWVLEAIIYMQWERVNTYFRDLSFLLILF